jgi:peptide/nickel transport system substrate-binding protein
VTGTLGVIGLSGRVCRETASGKPIDIDPWGTKGGKEMKRKIGWLVVSCLMVLALLLASCGPAVTEEEEEEEEGPEMVRDLLGRTVEKPRYGGVFNYALTSNPRRFDPLYAPHLSLSLQLTNEEMMIADWAKGPTGSGQASLRFDMFPTPDVQAGLLATSWEVTEPDTIVYHIRQGVHYALNPASEASRLVNGREVTADDVVFTLRRIWGDPKSYISRTYPHLSNMENVAESIYALDKWTVVLKSAPGKLGPVYEMASDYNTNIYPSEVIATYGDMSDWRNSVGTGPFMLVDYVPDSILTFEKNPNYWRKHPLFPTDTMPYLSGVRWLVIPDASTRYAALRTGKIDAVLNLPWEEARDLLKTNPELDYVGFVPGSQTAISGRMDKPESPYYDKKVRQALYMAIDQGAIVEGLYDGKAEILNAKIGNLPEFSDIYVPLDELPEAVRQLFEYNTDRARQLLAEAGYPDGFKTSIVCTATSADLLSIVKDYWAKIGVELTLDVKESAVFSSILFAPGGSKHDELIIAGYSSAIPFKFTRHRPGAGYNWGHVDDPAINEVIEFVDGHYFDELARRQAIKDINPYILEQAYYILLPAAHRFTLWQPWVKHYTGEFEVGYAEYHGFMMYTWIDQDLREEMTGRR